MSNPNSYPYYTSSRRSEGQQLPPLRNHLADLFPGPEYTTSTPPRDNSHNNASQTLSYSQSQSTTASHPRNSNNYNGRSQPGSVYSSHSRREEPTMGPPYGMYNSSMEVQRASEQPNFPTRPLRAPSGDDSRRYQCDVCNDRFDRPSALQVHMRTHTEERPFTCGSPGCGRSFKVKSNLRRHERTHTAASAFEPADADDPYNRSSGHYGNSSSSANRSSSTFFTSTSRRL